MKACKVQKIKHGISKCEFKAKWIIHMESSFPRIQYSHAVKGEFLSIMLS